MPGKKKSAMSKKMAKEVRKLAKETTLRLTETKQIGKISENNQLFHNVPVLLGPFLNRIKKGLNDPTLQTNANARIGDEILLKAFNQRYWLSNKSDRPNVMYRITTFWFSANAGLTNTAPTTADVYFYPPTTGSIPNVMTLLPNTEVISVISDKLIFSENNYAVDANNHERSQLRVINKRWKARKVKYLDSGTDGAGAGGPPKNREIYAYISVYDAYGTLQTDNIASFALNFGLQFKDL